MSTNPTEQNATQEGGKGLPCNSGDATGTETPQNGKREGNAQSGPTADEPFTIAIADAGCTPYWKAVLARSRKIEAETGTKPSFDPSPAEEAEIRATLPPVTCSCAAGGINPCCVAHTPTTAILELRTGLARVMNDRKMPAGVVVLAIELDNVLCEITVYPRGGFVELERRVRKLLAAHEKLTTRHASPPHS